MYKSNLKIFLALIISFVIYQLGAKHFNQVYSLDLDDVSVTISNSRPSFRGLLDGVHTAGSSALTIRTTAGAADSTSSAQLMQGDTVTVGTAYTMEVGISVASTSSLADITLATELVSGKNDGDIVISTQSANLTTRFKTTSAIAGGQFRILIPASSDDNLADDGIPDATYFDFSTTGATITCPADQTNYDFISGTGDATASATTLSGDKYHTFSCRYSGTGDVGEEFGLSSATDYFVINNLINPAPKSGHTTGTADTYSVIIQQLDASENVIDQTTTKIGVIEAVKVSATVAPSISFRIIGVAHGTSACGVTTDVTTTPASVPFATLSLTDFIDAAQALSVTTNAVDGYSVTAIANDQLGRNGGACTNDVGSTTCIRDSIGDDSNMSHTNSDDWTGTTAKGFAYSLHDINSTTTEAVAYNVQTNDCDLTPTFCARQFADAENSVNEPAQTIFSDTAPSDNDNLYVCYRVIPDVTTAAGFYENYITYTATGTF